MSTIQERYNPVVVGVDTTVKVNSQAIGGFLAVTSGSITIVNGAGTTVLSAFPVTSGVYVPLVMYLGGPSVPTFATAGGASGTLLA